VVAKTVRDVMTRNPVTVGSKDSCAAAARKMAERNIGDVLVQDDGRVSGIVTDRDIVVRAIAAGRDPANTTVGEVCTQIVETLEPTDGVEKAMRLMKDKAIRRIPVVEEGRAVGIVTLGDLAQDRDPNSVLGAVSAARPNG
jgi:signal-transduction protein with cAMP-binding, CBS, and nucleotidyltransferase domain